MPLPRVGIVTPELAAGGGVARVAAFLYDALHRSGRFSPHLVSLATGRRDSASVRLLSPTSWLRGPRTVCGVWEGRPFTHVGCTLAELEFRRYRGRRVLTELLDGYDLVQVVAGTPAWALVTRGNKRPAVLQVATLAREERKSSLRSTPGASRVWRRIMTRVTEHLDEAALRCVSTIFVENEWMLRHLEVRCPPGVAVWAPPGIDTDFFRPGEPCSAGYILSVGRFADPRKNVMLMLDAYTRLRRLMPDAPRLVLAGGSAPGPDALRFATREGIAPFLEVRERVTADELAELYRGASVFALSSDEEGFGLVLIEAMASGLPVVSTRCGGPHGIVADGETGFLVPVGDPDALARSLFRVLADPDLRRRLGQAGREQAVSVHSAAVASEPFLRRYDEILAAR